jgi:hypothetical protein
VRHTPKQTVDHDQSDPLHRRGQGAVAGKFPQGERTPSLPQWRDSGDKFTVRRQTGIPRRFSFQAHEKMIKLKFCVKLSLDRVKAVLRRDCPTLLIASLVLKKPGGVLFPPGKSSFLERFYSP